jgi:hypothetical protein
MMPLPLRLLHVAVMLTLAAQAAYCFAQVLVVLSPDGGVGPLWGAATTVAPDLLLARRLYAIEGWIAAVGLALYVGVTEILPRRVAARPG